MSEFLTGDDPNDEEIVKLESESNEPTTAFLDFQERLETGVGQIDFNTLKQSWENKEITKDEYLQILQVYIEKIEPRAKEALIDKLTGLVNRKGFDEDLDNTIEKLRSGHEKKRRDEIESIMIVALDMNDLKFLNDNYGHKTGDEALIALSDRLKECGLRPNDILARTGGDEFLILVKLENTEIDTHQKIFDRIKYAISNLSIPIKNRETDETLMHGIHTAAGYSVLTKSDARTTRQLLDAADRAMYEDKAEIKRQTN